MAENTQPIIIRRVEEESGHGHHGGAWKVAYADFVTAMMAFFLLLWLIATSEEARLKGLAQYFSEARENSGEPGGVGGLLDGVSALNRDMTIQLPASPFAVQRSIPLSREREEQPDPFELDLTARFDEAGPTAEVELADEVFEAERERREQAQFEAAKSAILDALSESDELADYARSLMIDQTPEGLRIQILDRAEHAMFPTGSAEMYPHTRQLIEVVVKAIEGLDQEVSIRGHTDSRPFVRDAGYDNWRLSSDRANATREALLRAGLEPGRIAEVVGRADAEHLVADNPNDPRNRRISLVLLREEAAPGVLEDTADLPADP